MQPKTQVLSEPMVPPDHKQLPYRDGAIVENFLQSIHKAIC